MARRRTASRSPGHAAAVAGHAWSSGRRPGGTCLGGGGTPAGGGMSTTLPICVTSLTFTRASRATRTVRASCPDSTRSWPRRARRSVHLDQRARAPCGPRSPTAEHDRQYVLQAKFHDRGDFSGIIPEKSPRSWSVGFRVCCTLISAFLHRAGRSCLPALAYTWPLAGPLTSTGWMVTLPEAFRPPKRLNLSGRMRSCLTSVRITNGRLVTRPRPRISRCHVSPTGRLICPQTRPSSVFAMSGPDRLRSRAR